ncbi:MAG: N-acetylmuramic acid 6-phosphate etherase [Candidatus Bathyarchaeota archaeon]|nr:N-acetylmuramic acid 6-phosphate etherase [Candidatus Bathyarchaeota archaeon]
MVRITEERNPNSLGIDGKPVEEILRIINAEDQKVPKAIATEIPVIAEVVEAIAATISKGGRVFFAGAGSSGRIGVAEAAEIPPTFGLPPEAVQGVMAGGHDAVIGSVEVSEDDEPAGARMLEERGFDKDDLLVALSASGRTPYALGALRKARDVGSRTVSLTCNPEAPMNRLADIPIVVNVGPEVVAGSTRMKAGTAQKLVLNMLTTAAMIRLGRVYDGLMIGVQPTNEKLRERATRIIETIAEVSTEVAARALDEAQGDVGVAIVLAKTGESPEESKRILDHAGGSLRRALKDRG